jgi:predicted SPOUT superfamily RNA methylase MTH1
MVLAFEQKVYNASVGTVFQKSEGENCLPKKTLSIAIPASVVSDMPHLREKTSKIGLIGRAAAIFKVDEIIVYPDNPKANQNADMDLVATLLAYMETPQYLRKRLFKLKPELQYAGILSPLRTPHHPLNRRTASLKVGEYREGVTVSNSKEGTLVDIGVEKPALIARQQLSPGKRVTVKVSKVKERLEAEVANREEIGEYWGYKVALEKRSFGELLRSRGFDLTVATSKRGVPLVEVEEKMAARWKEAGTVLLAFGAPANGLYEIVEKEGLSLDNIVDFVVNTIPFQATETVRTEEAVVASLAVLNVLFGL